MKKCGDSQARCPHVRIGVSARIAVSETGNDAKFTMSDEVKNDQIPISDFSDTVSEKSEIGIRNPTPCRGIHIRHFRYVFHYHLPVEGIGISDTYFRYSDIPIRA